MLTSETQVGLRAEGCRHSISQVHPALSYHARGWAVVLYPRRTKGPTNPGWHQLRLKADDIRRGTSEDRNVGVILGRASAGLTDVDLDSPLAVELAGNLLPDTGAV